MSSTSIRILLVHNAYQQQGGEDMVVEAEIALLRSRGHEVEAYCRHNDEIARASNFSVGLNSFWSRRTVADIESLIADVCPDVIHCHNTFPLISPSLYWAAARVGVPVVQTLHNFRLFCPQAMFLREGRVCEDCLGKVPWRSVVRGCYRGSHLQSVALAGMTSAHRALGTWQRKVTRFIALNDFCRNKFIEGGLPAGKVVVKPNFVDWNAPLPQEGAIQLQEESRHDFLFVGRLSAEKGIAVLMQAAVLVAEGVMLRVVGSGPEAHQLDGVRGVEPLGALSGDSVRSEMVHAQALVMPSICYENFPRTLVEAFACGLPVIASRLGAIAELVVDGETGLLFEPGNAADLAEKLRWARDNPGVMQRMGDTARIEYEAKYTPKKNYEMLMEVYIGAIDDTKNNS